jgi:hypothetical protein
MLVLPHYIICIIDYCSGSGNSDYEECHRLVSKQRIKVAQFHGLRIKVGIVLRSPTVGDLRELKQICLWLLLSSHIFRGFTKTVGNPRVNEVTAKDGIVLC